MSKRQLCEDLYCKIIAEGYVIPEGKTIRRHFMDIATTSLGMTEKGAGTYYVNAKQKAERHLPSEFHNSERPEVPLWSVIEVSGGTVVSTIRYASEERALSELAVIPRPRRQACMVVPGVVLLGEKTTNEGESDVQSPIQNCA